MNYSEDLQSRLTASLIAKGPDYKPRTQHLKNGQPVYTNRLIFEDSPYLLQHAHNPVDWYPWGKEVFERAREENKPVFLSIGYATCHWCHVMEEESFESVEIAEVLNEHFMAVKVDREQYPDIDQTYMTAVTILTGHGGWPMSSFLTHEGKPFFGGTYYTPATFTDLLLKVNQAWNSQHQTLIDQAEQIADAVHRENTIREQVKTLEQSTVQSAVDGILSRYDSMYGGFSQAPKFPNEPLLLLLLQAAERQPQQKILSVLNHTLSAMAQGGIYDQIGGGFHRYATDTRWLVPHFEKMLYNQAYLARIYARAYRLTGNPLYSRVARQTLEYVLREMTAENGCFFSATDADSEGHEGTYFIWTEEEIKKLMSPADAAFIIKILGVTRHGNFEGKNIFYLPESLDEVARKQEIPLDELISRVDPILDTLRKHREKRIPPLTDNKIIVSWNGMFITALAEAGELLNEPLYIEAAETAADAIWETQRPEKGGLWRVNLDGKASIPARQEDFVHLIEALLALYDATDHSVRLQQALSLSEEMLDQFLDASSGTLVMGRESLLFTQPKDAYDGALPSGNAIAVRVLSRLYRRSGESGYREKAAKILQGFSGSIVKHPVGYAYMLAQLDELENGETGSRQYVSGGAVKINSGLVKKNGQIILTVDLDIADGWHINANQPLQEDFIATKISLEKDTGWVLGSVSYPEPSLESSKFENNAAMRYQGRVQIRAEMLPESGQAVYPVHLKLQLQACNQDACLQHESILLSCYEPGNCVQ